MNYSAAINKLILKFLQKSKRPGIANTILKKNKFRRLTLPNFKIYYGTRIIKTVWYWQKKKKEIDQENRMQSRQKDRHKYSQLIFDKRAQVVQWIVLYTNGSRTTEHPHAKTKQNKNLDTALTSCTKINSKWIIDPNVNAKL